MALTKSLVTMGMSERLAQSLGTHWETKVSGAQGTVTISEPLTWVTSTSAAPNNYLTLPKIALSKTAFHVVYNGDGADNLYVLPTSPERLVGGPAAPAMIIPPGYVAAFWGGSDVADPSGSDWAWFALLSA